MLERRRRIRIRMPWWFWFAAIFGMFSFIPLLIAGLKLKVWLWIGLGIVHLTWFVFASSSDQTIFDVFMWSSIGFAIYVFTGMRKKYCNELLQRDVASQETILHEKYQNKLREEKIRLEYERQLYELKAKRAVVQTWDCFACGANNKNSTGECEYCGVGKQSNEG